jgi:NADH dehydrogenase, FAD-containing subunit
LRQLGIDVRTSTKVAGADAKGVILDGGARIDASLIVWAAGVKAPEVVSKLDGLEVNRKDRSWSGRRYRAGLTRTCSLWVIARPFRDRMGSLSRHGAGRAATGSFPRTQPR